MYYQFNHLNSKNLVQNEIDQQDENGNTKLHQACQENKLELSNSLLDKGANFTIKNNTGKTALDCLEEEMLKKLIATYKNKKGETLLHLAITFNANIDFITMLIKNKVDVTAKTKDNGFTALHYACQSQQPNIKVIQLLIKNKVDLNCLSSENNNPKLSSGGTVKQQALDLACENSNITVEIIEYLLNSISFWDKLPAPAERMLLINACSNKNISLAMIKLIMNHKYGSKDINIKHQTIQQTPLHFACKNESITADIINFLIEQDGNLLIKDNNYIWPLDHLIKNEFMRQSNFQNAKKQTLLHLSCIHYLEDNQAHINCIRDLFRIQNNNVNNADQFGYTPIDYLLENQKFQEIGKYLFLQCFEDIKNDNTVLINLLIENGIKPTENALSFACVNNYIEQEKLEWLLDNGANTKSTDQQGNTALHYAVMKKDINFDTIKLLLSKDANPFAKNRNNYSAFTFACANETITLDIIESLYKKCNRTLSNEEFNGCLLAASENKNSKIRAKLFSFLLDRGANIFLRQPIYSLGLNENFLTYAKENHQLNEIINYKDNMQKTLLHKAKASSSDPNWCRSNVVKLIDNGININAVDNTGSTVLHYFCKDYDPKNNDVLTELLKAQADLTIVDNDGNTALEYLCESNNVDVILMMQFLMQRTEESIEKNQIQNSLIKLCKHNNKIHAQVLLALLCNSHNAKAYPVIVFLLAQKISANIKVEHLTPLHIACRNNDFPNEIIIELLNSGAKPGVIDQHGMTALHLACKRKNLDPTVINTMIKKLRNTEFFDLNNDTPLHFACMNESISLAILEIFLKNGADINVSVNDQTSPFESLCLNKNSTLEDIAYCLSHGAEMTENAFTGILKNINKFNSIKSAKLLMLHLSAEQIQRINKVLPELQTCIDNIPLKLTEDFKYFPKNTKDCVSTFFTCMMIKKKNGAQNVPKPVQHLIGEEIADNSSSIILKK